MANEEQLSILRQGVDVWNQWRDIEPAESIDLRGANLSGINLKNANLRDANLTNVNFKGSDLTKAFFRKATLIHAHLNSASLVQANLEEANLTDVSLREAKLMKANLTKTTFIRADLSYADISDANLSDSNLFKANLRKATLWNVTLERADLRECELEGADFSSANLERTNLNKANLERAILNHARLTNTHLVESNLFKADLTYANLMSANLVNTNLRNANLYGADLTNADLSQSNLRGADLTYSILIKTKIDNAILSNCNVYGVSVWGLQGEFKEQKDLIITSLFEPSITIDNINIAQFVYLILSNKELRDVINTLTSKAVLILGRFAIPERKAILDALRNKLREFNLLPIIFDFDRPTDKDFTETIKTLAGLCYFVIADVTNPKSSPLELQATVPDYQIPFVPIIQEGERPFAMMVDLQKKYNWVLNTVSYDSQETLMRVLKPLIIDPAMKKRQELRLIKAQEPEIISAKDYLDKEKK